MNEIDKVFKKNIYFIFKKLFKYGFFTSIVKGISQSCNLLSEYLAVFILVGILELKEKFFLWLFEVYGV